MLPHERLIVAADLSSREALLRLVDDLQETVGMFKIGLQAFIANGPEIVRSFRQAGVSVFLDLKLHDIPTTVSRAVAEAAALEVRMLTVHTAGGADMLTAAAGAVGDPGQPLLLGVTVLTSLGDRDLAAIGFTGTPESNAVRLAGLALRSGLNGVIASPLEIRAIRESCGPAFLIVTPGIRAASDPAGDQSRTLTAKKAMEAGADFIVVGRPITGAVSPREAALRIVESMA
ncbi:MAG: orotidine-5'-phosphate decarboxylase [Acidobacteriota bacterium]